MPRLSDATTEEFRADAEALEHLGAAGHGPHLLDDPAVTRVSATIAILAVAGVILGTLESMATSAASDAGSAALMAQTRAADAWSALDARIVRQALAQVHPGAAGTVAPEAGGRGGGRDDEALARYARAQEQLSLEKLREAERHGARHHVLAWAVTMVQVAIAIATLSIIARPRRWPWLAGIGLGVAGALTGAAGLML